MAIPATSVAGTLGLVCPNITKNRNPENPNPNPKPSKLADCHYNSLHQLKRVYYYHIIQIWVVVWAVPSTRLSPTIAEVRRLFRSRWKVEFVNDLL